MHGNNMATEQGHNSSKLFQIYGLEMIDLSLAKVGAEGSKPFARSRFLSSMKKVLPHPSTLLALLFFAGSF